jgi:hypothetical protein
MNEPITVSAKSWEPLRRIGWLAWHKPGDFWLLVRLGFWVMAVTYAMPRYALPRLLRWLSPRQRSLHSPLRLAPQRAAYWLDRLLQLNRWVFTPVCWKRALVLHRVLGRSGIQTRVVFGVRQGSAVTLNPLEGHAWLECEGRPFLEKELPVYVVTYAFPP